MDYQVSPKDELNHRIEAAGENGKLPGFAKAGESGKSSEPTQAGAGQVAIDRIQTGTSQVATERTQAGTSKIINEPKNKFPLIVAIRELLEHRALWMYLLCDEARKAGVDPALFAPKAIKRCGLFQGGALIDKGGGTFSLKSLKKGLFGKAAQMVFEMDVQEVSNDCFRLEFHYCPLVKAWQKQGATDEEIAQLCDWAMCGDRGIGEAYGCKLDLPRAIGRGDATCQLVYYRPEGLSAEVAKSPSEQAGCEVPGGAAKASCAQVLDVDEVRDLERRLVASGTPIATLMERAGAALTTAVLDALEKADLSARPSSLPFVVILAGTGNNGGDGWEVARLLIEADAPARVTVVTPVRPEAIEAMPAHDAAVRAHGVIELAGGSASISVAPSTASLALMLDDAEVIVDCMLGIGFSGDSLREPYASWARAADVARWRDPGKTIIAADCPTGVDAQTGVAAQEALPADVTITMIAPKTGLAKDSARPYVGKMLVAPCD